MGESFASGLSSASGSVAAAASALGATAKANKGHYRGLKGMAADRIMLVENGQAMVTGFINGMDSQRAQLITTAQQLATDVRGAFSADVMPRIGVRGAMKLEQNVNAQITTGVGGDPIRVGQELQGYLDGYAQALGQPGEAIISV